MLARQLWSHEAGNGGAGLATVVVAERMLDQLRAGLGRWIGLNGSRMLLTRATRLVIEKHPALGWFPVLDGAGLGTAVPPPSARVLRAGVIALLAMVIELLGHLIGAEIAESLVQQSVGPSPRGVVSQSTP